MPIMLVMPPQLTGLDPAPTQPTCVPTSIYPLRRGGSRNSLGVVGQGQDVNYCPVEEAAGVAKFPYKPPSPTSAASRLVANFTLEPSSPALHGRFYGGCSK